MAQLVTHVVTHAFDAAGKHLNVGDLVNASNWRNTAKLVAVKYLRPVSPVDLANRSSQKPSQPTSAPTRKFKKLVIKKK